MEILGVILWFMMPAVAGYTVCNILRWKETNQIETYLIGFFFLFFLQGVILAPCVILNLGFALACNAVVYLSGSSIICKILKTHRNFERDMI